MAPTKKTMIRITKISKVGHNRNLNGIAQFSTVLNNKTQRSGNKDKIIFNKNINNGKYNLVITLPVLWHFPCSMA